MIVDGKRYYYIHSKCGARVTKHYADYWACPHCNSIVHKVNTEERSEDVV